MRKVPSSWPLSSVNASSRSTLLSHIVSSLCGMYSLLLSNSGSSSSLSSDSRVSPYPSNWLHTFAIKHAHCNSDKSHHFFICDNLVRCHSILLIRFSVLHFQFHPWPHRQCCAAYISAVRLRRLCSAQYMYRVVQKICHQVFAITIPSEILKTRLFNPNISSQGKKSKVKNTTPSIDAWCLFTWRTSLLNIIQIGFETTKPWAFWRASPNKKSKSRSDMGWVADPKIDQWAYLLEFVTAHFFGPPSTRNSACVWCVWCLKYRPQWPH